MKGLLHRLLLGTGAMLYCLLGIQTAAAAQERLELSGETLISTVTAYPPFAAFGRFLIPEQLEGGQEGLRLKDLPELLLWHSDVQLSSTLEVLKYLQEHSLAGERIFYHFYTPQEVEDDSRKGETGFFFFRGKKGAPFAVLCSGGGFAYVGSLHGAMPHAMELIKRGYNAFVLQYRTGSSELAPAIDLARALSYIFKHHEELGVSVKNYSLWGASAGGKIAGNVVSYGTADFKGDELPPPAAFIYEYSDYSEIGESEPPTYAITGDQDEIVFYQDVERRIDLLKELGVPVKLRVCPGLGHGFGIGVGTVAAGWVDEAVTFWEEHSGH